MPSVSTSALLVTLLQVIALLRACLQPSLVFFSWVHYKHFGVSYLLPMVFFSLSLFPIKAIWSTTVIISSFESSSNIIRSIIVRSTSDCVLYSISSSAVSSISSSTSSFCWYCYWWYSLLERSSGSFPLHLRSYGGVSSSL